jgi:dihydroflavonol-4-reductase
MIFVTGGTGLIGSRLLYDLASTGVKVRSLKRKTSDMTLVRRYFSAQPDLFQNIEWVEGDINDIFSLEDAMMGIHEVYHCAALVSFRSRDARRLMKVNAEGTANMINTAIASGVEGFCFVSSTAALGRATEHDLITENTLWKNSRYNSNYAISKLGAEREVWRGMEEGLPAVIVNPSIVLGPGPLHEGSTALFGAVRDGLKFYTTGSSGFVDVRDVSACMIQLMKQKIRGERFILNAENLSYRDLLNRMSDCLHQPRPGFRVARLMSEAAWRGEALRTFFNGRKPMLTKETACNSMRHWRYSNDKIRKALGREFIPVNESVEAVCRELLER